MVEFEVVTASNDDTVLRQNLLASPFLASGKVPLQVVQGSPSASMAYNRGLKQTRSKIVVFAHQDVYFPEAWATQLNAAIGELESRSVRWGVLGVWGVNPQGRFAGRVWCSGGNREHVGQDGLQQVCSVDEIVIVLNRDSGAVFDEGLPGFHLYGTDIILEAKSRGFEAFAFRGPVVHNSRFNPNVFDRHYFQAYRHMQRKWARQLPVETCCCPLTSTGYPLYRRWFSREIRKVLGRVSGGHRHPCGADLARTLGYDTFPQVEVAP